MTALDRDRFRSNRRRSWLRLRNVGRRLVRRIGRKLVVHETPLIGYVHERTTAIDTPSALETAEYVTIGDESSNALSRCLKSSVTMHAAWPSSLLPAHCRQCL